MMASVDGINKHRTINTRAYIEMGSGILYWLKLTSSMFYDSVSARERGYFCEVENHPQLLDHLEALLAILYAEISI